MVDVEQKQEAVVVKLEGDLGQPEARNLDLTLKSVVAQSPRLVVLDMSGVTLLASTAVASLLMLNRAVRKYGGRMRLAALRRQVLGALHFTRLDDILEICASVETAMETK